jgi:hypothetical protein
MPEPVELDEEALEQADLNAAESYLENDVPAHDCHVCKGLMFYYEPDHLYECHRWCVGEDRLVAYAPRANNGQGEWCLWICGESGHWNPEDVSTTAAEMALKAGYDYEKSLYWLLVGHPKVLFITTVLASKAYGVSEPNAEGTPFWVVSLESMPWHRALTENFPIRDKVYQYAPGEKVFESNVEWGARADNKEELQSALSRAEEHRSSRVKRIKPVEDEWLDGIKP